MYYKFIDKPQNGMRVYIEKMLDNKHPAYGIIREELRTPGENDYFTIKNGEIKLISGRRDQDEFKDVIVAYPKGAKDICVYRCLFIMDKSISEHLKDYINLCLKLDIEMKDLKKSKELVFDWFKPKD